MEKITKINVKQQVSETIIEYNDGKVLRFGGPILDETAIVAVVFQALYIHFELLNHYRDEFEITMTLSFE